MNASTKFVHRKSAAIGLGIVLCVFQPGMSFAEQPQAQIARGRYLVDAIGCGDCHSPKLRGMQPDPSRLLSGHPAEQKLPPFPKEVIGADKWGAAASNDFTAWAGPWGVSFAANLTPDKETGLGNWTANLFVKTMRTGKHWGTGATFCRRCPGRILPF